MARRKNIAASGVAVEAAMRRREEKRKAAAEAARLAVVPVDAPRMTFSDIHDADFKGCGSDEATLEAAVDEFDSRSEETPIETNGLVLVTLHTDRGRIVARKWVPRLFGDQLRAAGAAFPGFDEFIVDEEKFKREMGMSDGQFKDLLTDVGFYLSFDESRPNGAAMKRLYGLPLIPASEFEARLAKQVGIVKSLHTPIWGAYFAAAMENASKQVSIVVRENDHCVSKAFSANSDSWEMPSYSMVLDVVSRFRDRNPDREYRVTWWDLSNSAVRVVLAVDPDTATQSVDACGGAGPATFCPGIEVMVSQTSFCKPTIRDCIVVDGRDGLLPEAGVTVRDDVEMDDLIDQYEEARAKARALDASAIAGMSGLRLRGAPMDTLIAVMGKAGIAPSGRLVGKCEPGLPAKVHKSLWNAILGAEPKTMADMYVWIIRVYMAQTPALSTSCQEKLRTWLGRIVSWSAIVRSTARRRM